MKRPLGLLLCILIGLLGLAASPLASTAFPRGATAEPSPVQEGPADAPSPRPHLVLDEGTVPPARSSVWGSRDTSSLVLRLAVDRGPGPQRLSQALLRNLARDAYTPRLVGPGRPAEIYIGYAPPLDFHAWPFTPTRFVPVVSFWLPITEVTYADLERVFRGEVETWSDLGFPLPERVVPLSLATAPPTPLQPANGVSLPNTDTLVASLSQEPGGIALIPLEQVDVRLRALRVDGRDPILEETFTPGDPLVRYLFLALSPTVPDEVVERVTAFARNQRVASPEPAIEVVVVGDVMPGRMVERRVLAQGGDYTLPFAEVSHTLRQADLTIANLEGVLSDDIEPPTEPRTMLFVGNGCFCEGLEGAGIDGVSLANNHSMNFGTAGLSTTLALLQDAGIVPFGAGMDLEKARRPALFVVEGTTFAFLGYDAVSGNAYGAEADRAGTAPADPALIAADIAAAQQQADVVILYFHWGWEYTDRPSPLQKQLAHYAVEAGADVVLGSHPHWVQGLERYRGVLVLYSLGNFVFDQMWSPETRRGTIARLVFRGDRLVNLRLQAVQIEDFYQPAPLPAAEAEEVYRQMQNASPEWPDEKGVNP